MRTKMDLLQNWHTIKQPSLCDPTATTLNRGCMECKSTSKTALYTTARSTEETQRSRLRWPWIVSSLSEALFGDLPSRGLVLLLSCGAFGRHRKWPSLKLRCLQEWRGFVRWIFWSEWFILFPTNQMHTQRVWNTPNMRYSRCKLVCLLL